MSFCLTRAELRELSSRERPSAIRRWLQSRGIPFIDDADRWPVVLRAAILDQAAPTPQASEPQLRLQ